MTYIVEPNIYKASYVDTRYANFYVIDICTTNLESCLGLDMCYPNLCLGFQIYL